MRTYSSKTSLIRSGLAASVLLLASSASVAQVAVVDLKAAPTQAMLPDGESVPMWGYTCGAVTQGIVLGTSCAAVNPNAGANWSPVLITVPYTAVAGVSTTSLTITLTNNLSFGPNNIATSIVIDGQLGGGLGAPGSFTPSPDHSNAQSVTWPAADPITKGTPPTQGPRVKSFATEVAATPATTIQTPTTLTWNNLKPGTYLIHSGTHPSIQHPMGLYGVLVVTAAPVNNLLPGTAYGLNTTAPVTYSAEVPLLLSEIDPVQNRAVAAAVATAGFSETRVWSGLSLPGSTTSGCGSPLLADGVTANPAYNTCYPPAVNYDPRYYLFNGTSFDASNPTRSLFGALPAGATGSVLVRFVNAGLRMHVPSIVGAFANTSAAPVPGFALIAEDGNVLPGAPRVQSEVFLAAGKTYDVMINGSIATSLPVFDRQLSLSTNNQRNGGMIAYITTTAVTPANAPSLLPTTAVTATAVADNYSLVAGNTLTVSDPAKGVLANDIGIYGAKAVSGATSVNPVPAGLTFYADGTFIYAGPPTAGTTFTYCGNGATSGAACATVTISACTGACLGAAPVASNVQFKSNVAARYASPPPGVLGSNVTNSSGLPLSALGGAGVTLNADGSFVATGPGATCPALTPPAPAGATCVQFPYQAKTSTGQVSNTATATVIFMPASGLVVNVKDAKNGLAISDYRWIIEEDKTVWIDPKCQLNTLGTRTDSNGRPCPPLPVETVGYNFHTASMPVVASGCLEAVSCEAGQTLLTAPTACDVGNGQCRDATQKEPLNPSQVYLDPAKRYFISVLPGDGVNTTLTGTTGPTTVNGKDVPFDIARDCGPYSPTDQHWIAGGPSTGIPAGLVLCGHAMGGAQIAVAPVSGTRPPVNITLQQTPLPTAKVAVFVFQDDNPLNGQEDSGGGVDVIAPNEAGLGGFEIKLFDQAGGLGDATGQITYDMFNMPVSNSLAGTIDPITLLDACPIAKNGAGGIVGMIPTCPKFEGDGVTMSPLAGQAVIANLYPGLYEVVATPAADRIARGEEWLQTNTLDGGKAHEAFIKPNEPGYFQEFGPGGFHVVIGFANPKIINDRKAALCAKQSCNATLNVQVTSTRMSRTPDQRIYSSGNYDAYGFTQCYLSIGPPDGADFAFEKCRPDGTVTFTSMPVGNFRLTIFDQWNDLLLDGLVHPVSIDGSATVKEFPVTQWRTNLYTRTFIDTNGDGVSQDGEPGLPLVATNIRYRDGSFGFFNNTDLNGFAGFNEVFPFMNWLVVETDTTRYKPTGVHSVYDAGGPADGTTGGGTSAIASHLANTIERVPLPANLRVPGARYCADADCTSNGVGSTGRVDPPWVGATQGWQGLLGQNSFIEFGMKPFEPGENGGIKGHVIYASTRPFDDPTLLLQLSWEPGVPRVQINLYKQGTAQDGTTTLTLVDTTKSTSWDDWAQGFRSDGVPNMNCPGQDPTSPFFQTLKNSKQWLDPANPKTPLPNNSQFKCYDGWSMLNQIQPAPYDGMYKFPSIAGLNPTTGAPTGGTGSVAGTNCSICVTNPTDGTPMLPAGKYVVEVIVPPGYELVKEEDKNILLGDVYIAPVSVQFAGLGNIFIIPDQAAINAYYNRRNALNPTSNLGATPRHEGDTGSIETFWPCVGAKRIVPDFNSLFPTSGQNAPFAGALRPLCDRKEVTLEDQMTALAKFYIFSSTHIAGHFTGSISNDFASEFDPFSPQFGEKFGPPNLPVAMRDFTGNEVARVYSDQWGLYNGLFFSTYGVNPPNPTGYVPQMSIACMNDPGPIAEVINGVATGRMITDPAYSPAYSDFCYETPFMPGFTAYMDTPVIPTMAFADGYNLPDSEYPDATPAIGRVTGSNGVAGPWVNTAGQTLTISCLGSTIDGVPCSRVVQNANYSGPNAATAPYNQKTITRHYGFGSTPGTVTIAGVPATCTWSNTQLVCTVPTISTTQSSCGTGANQTPFQRTAPASVGTSARCGQLEITAANGKRSIDAITVTVAGKPPTVVTPTTTVVPGPFGRIGPSPIQTAIDNASPGDLIIVTPGTYRENLLMWKPVRLQGVGADSVTINADSHPAGKLDSWRRQVTCLFGLTIDGAPNPNNAAFDPSGTYTCPASMFMKVDRIPKEAFVGWDAGGNGNLAQILQEPTLMGAYEGAGVTVVGRGINVGSSTDFWGQATAGVPGAFPDGSRYLRNTNTDCATTLTNGRLETDYGTANFQCNPSRIDGVSIINSSQGGGGIFEHGWNHYLEIANTRIYGNHGTLSGAINLGNGETPGLLTNDGTICNTGIAPAPLCPPFGAGGSLIGPLAVAANGAIPHQLNVRNHVHHNMIINNASMGDALFSGTPSGAGGITISAGADNYTIDHNWIAANLSSGDGGGMVHSGVTFNGTIANNWILFNQSVNPTLPTNGGGLAIAGANNDRTLPNGLECGSVVDVDCPPGIGDGVGQGLVINANLIMGNSAESGSGGGLRLQQLNGSEVGTFPVFNGQWYGVAVTNNIIANNVAGWDGGGVSMQDALKVTFVNNTVASNDTTASAGVLFKTLGAINSSAPPPGCTPTPDPLNPQNTLCLIPNAPHGPQPAGLVTMANTPNLIESLPGIVLCPLGFGYSLLQQECKTLSKPAMSNNMFWQNRAFRVDIVGPGSGNESQQNIIALTPQLNQTATGQCPGGASYWDVGLRTDDLAAGTVPAGTQLTMTNSIFTTAPGVVGSNNFTPGNSPVIAQYCNGARVPPENCSSQLDQATCRGFNAPPGRSETTGLSPVFTFNNITPSATVDEGNNWLNLTYGPLTLSRPNATTPTAPELMVASAAVAATGGAYSIGGTSAAVNRGANAGAPATDFFGNPRPRLSTNPTDVGAVEFQIAADSTLVVVNPAPLRFTDVVVGSTTTRDLVVSNNSGSTFNVTGLAVTLTTGFTRVTSGSFTNLPPNCSTAVGATLSAGASCTIRVQWTAPGTPTTATGTATVTRDPGATAVTNSPVTINANSVLVTRTATLSPNLVAFGNWANGTTSAVQNVTVTNTGNSALPSAGNLSYTLSGSTTFTRVFSGTFPAGAPNCGNTLAVGASCTVKVQFAPTSVRTGNQTGTLTVAGTGVTVTPVSVSLTGTGVAAPAVVSVAPLTITLLTGTNTDTSAIILTNAAPQDGTGASLTVSNVAITSGGLLSGGSLLTYFFNLVAGQDACTGQSLPPGGTCTVGVRFTNMGSPRGVNHSGTVRFTSNGTPSQAPGALTGFATP
jgi:hypothetical protein